MKFALEKLGLAILVCALIGGCQKESSSSDNSATDGHELVGQWRASLQFTSGAFAGLQDLEFLYVFNQGGTMTESSNYDEAPPVAPAYGIWRKTGFNQFEAKYEFFLTDVPDSVSRLTQGGGWMHAGLGVLTEQITLSSDGMGFTSKIRYQAFDKSGKELDGSGEATGQGAKMVW